MNINFPSKNRCVLPAAAIVFGASIVGMLPAYAEYNVTKYGAKGDGITDDSDAIQKAINAAAADKSDNRVVFPPGQYLYSKPIMADGVGLYGYRLRAALISDHPSASIIVSGQKPGVANLVFKTTSPGGAAIVCKNSTLPIISSNLFENGFSKDIDAQLCNFGAIYANTFKVSDFGQGISGFDLSGVMISENVLTGDQRSSIGINLNQSSYCKIEKNKLSYFKNSIALSNCSHCELAFNKVDHSDLALAISASEDCSCKNNQIDYAGQQGIYEVNCSGKELIDGNLLSNCGLNARDPAAAIFVDSPEATKISIGSNSYSGSRGQLKYFIRSMQAPPAVDLSGNTTNSLLPDKTGPCGD